MTHLPKLFLSLSLITAAFGSVSAQTAASSPHEMLPDAPQPEAPQEVTLKGTPLAILHDQKAIWTSPAHIRTGDLKWLAPLAVATGVAIATDHHVMGSVVSRVVSFNNANVNASNVLAGGLIAAPVALFGVGQWKENSHARETGILAGEAILDSVVVEQGMKLIFWRERPSMDNARGLFFQGSAGTDSGFPSSHSVLAWSSAAVIAEEYPSRLTQLGVYSLATGVSLTRVLGQEHFPTDALVGSAAGWLVGHYVYRSHHRSAHLTR